MDLFDRFDSDQDVLSAWRLKAEDYYARPVMDPRAGHRMNFRGKPCVIWSLNNYLGLAENPELSGVAEKAIRDFGFSAPMGSRMMTGNTEHHIALEKKLAEFLGREASLVFNTGYLGIMGTIASVLLPEDTVIMDKLSHASMVDGVFLSKSRFRVFRHNAMEDLESKLKWARSEGKGGILIVTEGVFGMKGDLAPLPEIYALKDKYGARLLIDDAHGFGVMGDQGRGTPSHYAVPDRTDIYMGTFSKAFASMGSFAASGKNAIEWIWFYARSNLFTKSMPMVFVKVIERALDIVRDDGARRKRLFANARRLKDGLLAMGLNAEDNPSPITPIYFSTEDMGNAERLVRELRDRGVFVTGVVYPVVPKGIICIRMVPTASHTDEDIDLTLKAFREVRDLLNLKA